MMPAIPIKHVVSFSSEDKNFPADNLLKAETYRKWKCKEPGEKQISAVIQFTKATEIHSVDIGNEGSAFIEVLVGNSSDVGPNYQVLLPTSSFMSLADSKSGTNLNRVRMFDVDKLSKTVQSQKWDLVKIICTQPFTKYIQYGLSFIKFHSPPSPDDDDSSQNIVSTQKLGAFSLKSDDKQKASVMTPGSLFAKQKISTPSTPLTGAAAIRQASSSVKTVSPAVASKPANGVSSSNFKGNVSTNTKVSSPKIRQNENKIGNNSKISDKNVSSTKDVTPSRKRSSDIVKKSNEASSVSNVPFNEIMKKVVFALSGFKNPTRGDVRDKALKMGAKYRNDWDKSCTHLVCAFMNTPKYNQVKAIKGAKIVMKEWIEDCHRKKVLMPWRRYGLGDGKNDSDGDNDSGTDSPPPKKLVKSSNFNADRVQQSQDVIKPEFGPSESRKSSKLNKVAFICKRARETDADVDAYNDSTDAEDTDDEIQRIQRKTSDERKPSSVPNRVDTSNVPLPDLPNFFDGKYFFLYGEYSHKDKRDVNRVIVACGGTVEEYMTEKVNFVVTDSDWDKNFEDAMEANPEVIFIRSLWIWECSVQNKLVEYGKHQITS